MAENTQTTIPKNPLECMRRREKIRERLKGLGAEKKDLKKELKALRRREDQDFDPVA